MRRVGEGEMQAIVQFCKGQSDQTSLCERDLSQGLKKVRELAGRSLGRSRFQDRPKLLGRILSWVIGERSAPERKINVRKRRERLWKDKVDVGSSSTFRALCRLQVCIFYWAKLGCIKPEKDGMF